jgi:hypothetical protein
MRETSSLAKRRGRKGSLRKATIVGGVIVAICAALGVLFLLDSSPSSDDTGTQEPGQQAKAKTKVPTHQAEPRPGNNARTEELPRTPPATEKPPTEKPQPRPATQELAENKYTGSPAAPPKDPPPYPGKGKVLQLLHQANLEYLGAFRVPNYYNSTDEFSYGGTALAFNPANNSLFVVAHNQSIGEISIPQSIVNSNNLGKLDTAKVLQDWTPVLPKLPTGLVGATDGQLIGGLFVDGEQLIGTDYAYYSGADKQVNSHFVLSSLKLSDARIKGLCKVGSQGGRWVAGYMTAVPEDWQATLGASVLTGQGDVPIVSTTSSGPAAFGFDPKKLGSEAAPATPYVYYPSNNPLGPYTGPANPLQNGNTAIGGAAFVSETSSVLYFGTTATNYAGYGTPEEYGDSVHGGKGPHSLNGEYAFQVWAYDAHDFGAAKQGKVKPWQVVPYDVWNFTLPIPGSYQVGGVAFDPKTGRLYVSILNADREAFRSSLPLFEVFQVNLTVAAPKNPHIGTLSAAPAELAVRGTEASPAPGPVPAGASVVLTAGNVYPIGTASIAKVSFYLDKVGGKPLGSGTASKVPNAGHNWTLTVPTKGMAPGPHKIVGQAEDTGGLLSDPIVATLTIK